LLSESCAPQQQQLQPIPAASEHSCVQGLSVQTPNMVPLLFASACGSWVHEKGRRGAAACQWHTTLLSTRSKCCEKHTHHGGCTRVLVCVCALLSLPLWVIHIHSILAPTRMPMRGPGGAGRLSWGPFQHAACTTTVLSVASVEATGSTELLSTGEEGNCPRPLCARALQAPCYAASFGCATGSRQGDFRVLVPVCSLHRCHCCIRVLLCHPCVDPTSVHCGVYVLGGSPGSCTARELQKQGAGVAAFACLQHAPTCWRVPYASVCRLVHGGGGPTTPGLVGWWFNGSFSFGNGPE
jgi:hypothetical protein